MHVISQKRLLEFWAVHPGTRRALQTWYRIASAARWTSFDELRRTFPSADLVRLPGGKAVVVFDVGGNNVRLIAAVHYPRPPAAEGRIYVLLVLRHSDYDRGAWKERV